VEERDLEGMVGIRKIEYGDAALIPSLRHDVAPGHGNQRAVVRDAVFLLGLWRWQLVVARRMQLSVLDREDGVRAPLGTFGGKTLRQRSSTPLVGEQPAAPVVAERRRM